MVQLFSRVPTAAIGTDDYSINFAKISGGSLTKNKTIVKVPVRYAKFCAEMQKGQVYAFRLQSSLNIK